MAAKNRQAPPRKAVAQRLCKHFEGTQLVAWARAGLGALEPEHRDVILEGTSIGCGVNLDLCRRQPEPEANRWDYVFTERDKNNAVAIEVHHTAPGEVVVMIAKKAWAQQLLANECPTLNVLYWLWVASPPAGEVFILRQSPAAKLLADAKIEFPRQQLTLP